MSENEVSQFITEEGCIIQGVMLNENEKFEIYCPIHEKIEYVHSFKRSVNLRSKPDKFDEELSKNLKERMIKISDMSADLFKEFPNPEMYLDLQLWQNKVLNWREKWEPEIKKAMEAQRRLEALTTYLVALADLLAEDYACAFACYPGRSCPREKDWSCCLGYNVWLASQKAAEGREKVDSQDNRL